MTRLGRNLPTQLVQENRQLAALSWQPESIEQMTSAPAAGASDAAAPAELGAAAPAVPGGVDRTRLLISGRVYTALAAYAQLGYYPGVERVERMLQLLRLFEW